MVAEFLRESQGVDIVKSLYFTTVMTFGGPVGCLIAYFINDRVGRKPIMIIGSLVTAVLALIYPFMSEAAAVMGMGFLLVTSIYVWIATGQAILPELFAIEYRFRGSGFSSSIGRLLNSIGAVCDRSAIRLGRRAGDCGKPVSSAARSGASLLAVSAGNGPKIVGSDLGLTINKLVRICCGLWK